MSDLLERFQARLEPILERLDRLIAGFVGDFERQYFGTGCVWANLRLEFSKTILFGPQDEPFVEETDRNFRLNKVLELRGAFAHCFRLIACLLNSYGPFILFFLPLSLVPTTSLTLFTFVFTLPLLILLLRIFKTSWRTFPLPRFIIFFFLRKSCIDFFCIHVFKSRIH